jgi:hypothetical protein
VLAHQAHGVVEVGAVRLPPAEIRKRRQSRLAQIRTQRRWVLALARGPDVVSAFSRVQTLLVTL